MAEVKEKAVGTVALGVFKTQMEKVVDDKIAEAEKVGSDTEFATEQDILDLFKSPGENEA